MATRLYMPYGLTPPTQTITKHAEWESETSNVLRQPLLRTIPSGLSGSYTFLVSEASSTVHDQMCAQFISEPLTAQTITGTVSGVWLTREAGSTYDFGTQMCIRVFSYDGTILRGTLYAPHTYTTTANTGNAVNREFLSTGYVTRLLPGGGGALTSVAALAGDRLVVEIGVRACNLVATTRTADPIIQLQNGWTDCPLIEGNTSTTVNHWIEISSTLTFDPTYTPPSLNQFRGWGVPIR